MYSALAAFLGIVILFLLISTFFSLAETALMTVSKFRIRYLAEKGDRRARLVKYLVRRPDKLLGTILIGDNVIDVALGSLTAYFITVVLHTHKAGFYNAVASAAVAIITVVFGKILPKTIAVDHPESLALRVAYPMRVFMALLYPIVRVSTFVSNTVARWMGVRVGAGPFLHALTEDELRSLITSGEQPGLAKEKQEMLHGIFEFGDTRVKEVMISRTEVTAINVNSSLEQVLKTIQQSGYSRIPVYRDHFDNMLGILYTKDLLPLLLGSKTASPPPDLSQSRALDLEKILHPVHFVPDTAKIEKVLSQLQRLHLHMAIVIDEFGGVEGIVTLEDILEEIVGEIQDEYDLEQDTIRKVSTDVYVVRGTIPIRDFNKRLKLNIPETNDYTTLAGFLITLTGRLLKAGDKVTFENMAFEIEKVQAHKIVSVRLRIMPPDKDQAEPVDQALKNQF
jgi:CBS domain containing-hemolysin-like protein